MWVWVWYTFFSRCFCFLLLFPFFVHCTRYSCLFHARQLLLSLSRFHCIRFVVLQFNLSSSKFYAHTPFRLDSIGKLLTKHKSRKHFYFSSYSDFVFHIGCSFMFSTSVAFSSFDFFFYSNRKLFNFDVMIVLGRIKMSRESKRKKTWPFNARILFMNVYT